MRRRLNTISNISLNLIIIVICIAMLLPLVFVISASFSTEKELLLNGYSVIPQKPTLDAYRAVFKNPEQIASSYAYSLIITTTGTIMGVTLCAMLGYVLSRKDYRLGRATAFFVLFPLLFSGGLVPFYILMTRYFHLKNSILALILPYVLSPWFVIILKGFLSSVPSSLIESAKIDGASETAIFLKIIIPISTSALATVAVFYILLYWNDWWLGMLFIDKDIIPLQLMLYRIVSDANFLVTKMSGTMFSHMAVKDIPGETLRMAAVVVAAGPILFIFPFFHRFFARGIVIGSLKG